MLALAGCDRVFGLGDPYEDAATVVDGPRPISDVAPSDVPADDSGGVVPALLLYESFDQGIGSGACTGNGCLIVKGGHKNSALTLDGNSCVKFNLPDKPSSFTIAFWAKANAVTLSTMVSRRVEPAVSSTEDVWKLTASNAAFTFEMYNNSDDAPLTTPHGFARDAFHHFAVTYDGNVKSIYVDGVQQIVSATVSPPVYGSDSVVFLGCEETSMTGLFDGSIDELYIFSGDAGPTEIAALAM